MNTLETSKKAELSQKQEPEIRGFALWAVYVFKFFASLKFAIALIASLMAVLAAGTFVESAYGTDTARILIYQSPWFACLLFLLAANLAAAALDRLPWKVKHAGFVITHIGIILILFGSFVTQKMMVDGQMSLAEGESGNRLMLTEPLLYIYSGADDRSWYFDLKKKAFPWHGEQNISHSNDGDATPFQIKLLADYPKAAVKIGVVPSQTGKPAVKVMLHNSFVDQEQWLMQDYPDLGEIQMGPAKLKFAGELLPEAVSEVPQTGTGYLEFQFEKQSVQVPLKAEGKLPVTLALEGTPYKIEIQKLFRNAVVNGKVLQEQEDSSAGAGKNPAAELLLLGPEVSEKHTVFANFPDFPTVHGMKPSAVGMKLYYRKAGGGSRAESHEIRFVQKDKKLFCQIIQGPKVVTHEVKKGEAIATGWMGGLSVTAQEFYPQAAVEQSVAPESNLSENPEHTAAIQLRFILGAESKTLWLREGIHEETEVAGRPFTFIYTQKRTPLEFKLQLKDFRLQTYAGTDRPASFESDVILKDEARGVVKETTISMNKPLEYRGFHIYQSGYAKNEGEPEISVFAIGKDAGVPIKYAGAIVMVAGIITMFYTRRFSTAGTTL